MSQQRMIKQSKQYESSRQADEYDKALEDPIKQYYITQYKLLKFDANYLWIIDALWEAKMSQPPAKLQKIERFYKRLYQRLCASCKKLQFNSYNYIITQKPPLVVRRILHMCAYLNIDYQTDFVWLAILSLSLKVPPQWTYNQQTKQYKCTDYAEFVKYCQFYSFSQEQIQQNMQMGTQISESYENFQDTLDDVMHTQIIIPTIAPSDNQKKYQEMLTKKSMTDSTTQQSAVVQSLVEPEKCQDQCIPFHPLDPFILYLKQEQISQKGSSVIIPLLTEPEKKYHPKNTILLYDLRTLSPIVINVTDRVNTQLLQIPQFSIGEIMYQDTIAEGLIQANQPVISSYPSTFQYPPSTDFDIQAAAKYQQETKINKHQVYYMQMSMQPIPDIVTRVIRSKRPIQPVDPQYVLNFIGEKVSKLVFYGFVFVDYKTYRLLRGTTDGKSSGDQSSKFLNNEMQCSLRANQQDTQIQLRIAVGVLSGQGINDYLGSLKQDMSRTMQSTLSRKGIRLQQGNSNNNDKELIVGNVDDTDYILGDDFDALDFKLGLILQVGNYQFALSQLSQEATEWLNRKIRKLNGYIDNIMRADIELSPPKLRDPKGPIQLKGKQLKKVFAQKTNSPREMARMLADLYTELKRKLQDAIDAEDIFCVQSNNINTQHTSSNLEGQMTDTKDNLVKDLQSVDLNID